jgi:hypothetical protein
MSKSADLGGELDKEWQLIGKPKEGEPCLPHRDHAGKFFVLDAKHLRLLAAELAAAVLVVPKEAGVSPLDLHAAGGDRIDLIA